MNVYGDMLGSDIHHNYYGMFSFGLQGGQFIDNRMHDNIEYGEGELERRWEIEEDGDYWSSCAVLVRSRRKC